MPDLFLSYSRDDSLTMGVIRDNLRKLGFNVWVDIEHLKPGTPQWVRAVRKAIRSTDAMIVLCSPPAERSDWVNREIHEAKAIIRSGQGRMKVVIPVLIRGDETNAIPFELVGDQYVDMRGRSVPEYGFRELVKWLAEGFDTEVPDYKLHASGSMEVPTVQIINIQEHHEGHVINIGGDMTGEVNVAGRDIHQYAPPPPAAAQPERDAPIPPTRRTWLNEPRAIIIGAVITGMLGLIGAVVVTGGFGLIGSGTQQSSAIESPTQTAGQLARQLAEAGVTSNADWTPYTEEINGVEMALVPMGCFQMGSTTGYDNEEPVHEVCFEKPFWIDMYEVTNEAFGSVGCESSSSEPDQPRNCVSWLDSLAHCEARGARLPTEAEWEYAARGPDGVIYPWGNTFDGTLVDYCDLNCGYSWRDAGVDDGYEFTAPVGSYPSGASWVGGVDLSGNVWEWVNDWYDSGYYETLLVGGINPQGPGAGNTRVLRGGSWNHDASSVRGAKRGWNLPSGENDFGGFRCARSYTP